MSFRKSVLTISFGESLEAFACILESLDELTSLVPEWNAMEVQPIVERIGAAASSIAAWPETVQQPTAVAEIRVETGPSVAKFQELMESLDELLDLVPEWQSIEANRLADEIRVNEGTVKTWIAEEQQK